MSVHSTSDDVTFELLLRFSSHVVTTGHVVPHCEARCHKSQLHSSAGSRSLQQRSKQTNAFQVARCRMIGAHGASKSMKMPKQTLQMPKQRWNPVHTKVLRGRVHNNRLHHRQCRLEAFLCLRHRQHGLNPFLCRRQAQQRSQNASVALALVALMVVTIYLTLSMDKVLGVQ